MNVTARMAIILSIFALTSLIGWRCEGTKTASATSQVAHRWSGIVLHHSATPTTTTTEQIRRYHVEKRRWDDIAYHFVIESNGHIERGRGLDVIGAHALNPSPSRNRTHIGICLIGNDSFSRHQHEALGKLLGKLRKRFGTLRIEPHHEKCPGTIFEKLIQEGII